jgi:hypothetical protein
MRGLASGMAAHLPISSVSVIKDLRVRMRVGYKYAAYLQL